MIALLCTNLLRIEPGSLSDKATIVANAIVGQLETKDVGRIGVGGIHIHFVCGAILILFPMPLILGLGTTLIVFGWKVVAVGLGSGQAGHGEERMIFD